MSHLRTKRFSIKLFLSRFSKLIIPIAILFISIGFIFSLSKIEIKTNKSLFESEKSFLKHNAQLILKNKNILYLQIASSSADRENGLSFKEKINDNEGMLFVFENAEVQKFWMKDMNFDLDIIWFISTDNKKLKIVHVEKNVSKNSYNKEVKHLTKIYQNPENFPANYVLEINAGLFDKLNLNIGDEFELKLK